MNLVSLPPPWHVNELKYDAETAVNNKDEKIKTSVKKGPPLKIATKVAAQKSEFLRQPSALIYQSDVDFEADTMDLDGSRHRPDTKVKLYPQVETHADRGEQLQELKSLGQGLVLQLAENIQGNVFNKPFPFLHLRSIPGNEKLPDNLRLDGDPYSDFFFTVRSVRRDKGKTIGYVFMGFKVLNNDQVYELDQDWKEWTGTAKILRSLSRYYAIKRVQCWKANSVKPDIFKYAIVIEIAGDNDDLEARDILQKFRLKRMSGYVALYKDFNKKAIEEAMQSNDSLGAIVSHLGRDSN